MFDLATLRYINRQAERASQRAGKQPQPIDPGDVRGTMRKVPFIGERCPRGWKRVNLRDLKALEGNRAVYDGPKDQGALFVDMSGWGRPGERALAVSEIEQVLKDCALEKPGIAWGLLEQGQFQGHIVAFERRAS